MTWVEHILKCPDEGAWVALTRVDSDGQTRSLGYVSLPFREQAGQNIEAELDRRGDELGRPYWLADLSVVEVVDLVLDQMHPNLPADIDKDPSATIERVPNSERPGGGWVQ